MALRYLIYSTGTTFSNTIVRESATNNPGANEASFHTDFIIPEIQPLYLWRVDTSPNPTDVIPNTDSNISNYLESIAPPPEPEDDASIGFVTGITETKIDKVTGATGNIGTFVADGGLEDSGYAISDLTGGTSYNFVGSGGTQVVESGSNPTTVTIYSAIPTGTTVAWGDITGTLSAQTDLQNALNLKLNITDFNSYTGTTATELNGKLESSIFNTYTGDTQPVIDSAITGVTNLGTGTTIGSTNGRNITIKSISAIGGVTLAGDADNLIISGETNAAAVWGNITGTLSNQTDLQNALNAKTDNSTFNTFTGTTLPANYYNKTEINSYTASTETTINNKLETSLFNTYTGDTDTRISNIEDVTDKALTGATNGLVTNGRNVELGGGLTRDTLISGTTFDFNVNTKYIKLQAVNGIEIIDTDGIGGINIESDAGTIALIGNTNVGVEQTKVQISETQMLITDSRGTQKGFEYAADYSTTFTNESLITKRYADAIAAGLIPKAAVLVTTTGESINLATGGLLTVDGLTLSNGDRVLVKDQVDATQNGIYIASASTWVRSTDYDGNPNGEVSGGNIIPVTSGDTQYSSLWVLVTPNPITVGTTELDFSLFSSPHEMIAGTGIDISGNVISVDGASLAGNSVSWTGDTFNVDVNSGTLSTALDSKLNVTDFNHYSGTTVPATYLSIDNFNTFTGTTLPANYYNKTEINTYTGATDTRLNTIESEITYISGVTDTKLDTSVFNTYTGTTETNEIFLTHTGGTELNTITATAIDWDTVEVSGSSFLWSGGSDIFIQEAGQYEVSYNIPFNTATARNVSIGMNIIKNNTTVIDITASADGGNTNIDSAGSVNLPTVILTLTLNDKLTLAAFRTEQNGSVLSSLTGSILIKKKNTLQ